MPMGRVLTMDGRISPDIFQLALEAQSIIRDGLVPPDVGIEALAVAARDRQPIHEALKRMDRHPQAKGSTNRLGELLVDADIISTEQLNAALKASVETGLPLGGTLVTQGIIHASLLPTVLRAQEQIRDGILPRDAAIEELKAAMKIWSKAEAAMKRTDYATEQPLKPSSVMSTLRDTLEGPRPQPQHQQSHHQQQHQHQPQPHPYQQQPPHQVPVHVPPQHQPSQLHAQLQQQYFQDQQPQHQQPQGHPMQHQQTQPMQMPPQMQQPMPQQMHQPIPPQMQQPMPQQMQQPMPQQMQQPVPPQMQQPMPPQMPAPIYGYNTPYGHAPYGGPAPDDPWGSWHGSVPRHHGLGVPLPGFPQPPSMPPEGYAPPPGYPQQMPPQGAPPPPNWNMPAQNAPMPPQQMPQQASNLHAQLQQQQQMQHQHQTPSQPMPQPQPVHQQHATPVPQHSAPPASLTPQVQHQHQAETIHDAVSAAPEILSSQVPVSASSAPAATVPPPPAPTPAPPFAAPLPASPPVLKSEPVRAEDASKDPGQLKNAAAQLASRLGWAAPKGGDGDAAADLPSPRKLSWGQPQITSLDSAADTATQEPAPQQKSEPVPAVPARPEAAPLSTSATSTPSSEMRNPFGAPSGAPAGSSTPVSSFPVSKGPESQPEQPKPAFASPPVSETPSTASPAAPSQDFQPSQREEVEIPPEKDLLDLVKDAEEEDDDDEPNFKMEFDLELPAPFNKPVEQLRNEAAETNEKAENTDQSETEPKSEAKVEAEANAEAEAEAKSETEPEKVQAKVEEAPKEEQAVPVQAPTPVAETPAVKPTQKPVGLPISMPISVPIETGRPGHIAGFGKGTKISLKSDYAPSDTGRLFAITPSEALTLLAEDDSDSADDKKETAPAKGKKGKSKASQSQNKLSKQPAKGKKGQAGKSQTGLQSIKEAEAMPSWTTQKNQAHPAAMFGKKGGAGVPDFIEDLVPAAQAGLDASAQICELMPVGPGGKASNTQSKMASIKQRAVSVSVSNLLPVPLEIAEAQAELAYIVEHRGAPATPVTYTPPPPLPPQPQADATIVELLTMSGFFSKKDIATALEKALEDASMAPDLLMALGLVNDDTLDVVVRCQGLTRSRYLTNEQAIYVLGAVRSGRLSFEEALVEIGK